MAKFCTNCGKELDENTAMCLNCGVLVGSTTTNNNNNNKKEKKKGLPTWAIVLIIVGCFVLIPLILVIVVGITIYNVAENSDIDFEEYIEQAITQKGTIGDTLKTDDFKITLTNALLYSSIGDNNYYQETPSAGKEYLVFFLDVENISDESQYISNYNFSGYADGYTVSVKYLLNDIDNIEALSANLAPGKKTKGFIAFEVDTTWEEFELHFSNLLEDEALVFTVVNEESSDVAGA